MHACSRIFGLARPGPSARALDGTRFFPAFSPRANHLAVSSSREKFGNIRNAPVAYILHTLGDRFLSPRQSNETMRVQRRARRLPRCATVSRYCWQVYSTHHVLVHSFTLGLVLIAQHAPNAIARPTSLLPRGLLPIAASVALYTPFASAQQVPQGSVGKGTADTSEPCSWSNACPSNAPCCSEFGACGAGVSCLGGCNPQFSANSRSVPLRGFRGFAADLCSLR